MSEEKGVQKLIETSEVANQIGEIEKALQLLNGAFERAASDDVKVEVAERRANLRVSIQDRDGAIEDYSFCLSKLRGSGSKVKQAGVLLYLGQLQENEKALASFKEAISLLESENKSNSPDDIKSKLVKAYCTVAELYMTDLCFEENAESECSAHVEQALALATKEDIDAFQTAASLRLSQQRPKEASVFALRVFDHISVGCEGLARLVGLSSKQTEANSNEAIELAAEEADHLKNLPDFEFRLQTARLLLECAHSLRGTDDTADRCTRSCIAVLGSLLAENDEVEDVWSMTGDAHSFLPASEERELAVIYWQRALDLLDVAKTSLEASLQVCDDDEDEDIMMVQLEELTSTREAIQKKINQQPE